MRKIILIFVIQQLLSQISRVESLIGHNLIRIRGGEFPFIASFQYIPGEDNFCGGALIAKQHVLTLARCLDGVRPQSFRIVFEVAHAQEPALSYSAASWTTYVEWAGRQGIPFQVPDMHVMAIVTLTDRVYHVNPVALSGLTASRLNGMEAKMIGWNNGFLSKTTVEMLSNEDCERSMREISINFDVFDNRTLFSAANPFALLSLGDRGSPLLDARDNSLLGIASGFCPGHNYSRGNLTTEFIRQHQVNIHVGIYYHRLFVHSSVPAAPGA